ncbi:MAG: outer membrane lipoprotein-sorting protein [Deltaproteobacteria bacterium]|nr:outer membrane lipoprotein-sorting protein [Deltaproteobacteria bacterium]
MNLGWSLYAALLLAASPQPAATGADLDAGTIVKKAMARNLLSLTGTAHAVMKVKSAKGGEKTRDFDAKLLRTKAGMQQVMISFRTPPEVAGTAFLVLERPDGPPDQYLYLPALKKVRRIAAGQATDSFMGSDFSYLDLSPLPAGSSNDVEFKRLPDTEVGGQPVYVVDASMKIAGSPYSKVTTSIHREHFIPLQMEFCDAFGKPLKVLRVTKIKKIDDRLLPVEAEMKNLQKGSSTVLELAEIDLKAKLSEAEFTPEAMQQ